MTTFALKPPYPLFKRAVNTGSSPEARRIQEHIEKHVCHFRAKNAERQPAFIELGRLRMLGEVDIRRHGEKQLSEESYQLAIRFLCALPTSLPAPDVGIDPDGEVNFEWLYDKDRILTVSASENGRLSFAASLRQGISNHGTEMFDDTIPQQIISLIERLGSPS